MKVQLAKAAPLSKLEFPLYAELKYDGVRMIITKQYGTVEFRTRNNKLVSLPRLENLIHCSPKDNFMLDTEVTLVSGKMTDRTLVSGMINSRMHGGVINDKLLQFNIFDAMDLANFARQECPFPYSARRHLASDIRASIAENIQFTIAKQWRCINLSEVESVYSEVIAKGYEGLILKGINSKYLFKRTAEWTKMKEVKSADLEVIAIKLGTGKYEGMIGALTCVGIVEGHDIAVSVGTGLSDVDRVMPHFYYIGSTIEVKYNTVIQNKVTEDWSLFLPRYVCVRFDK